MPALFARLARPSRGVDASLEESGLLDEPDAVPVRVLEEAVASAAREDVGPVDDGSAQLQALELSGEVGGLEARELTRIDGGRRTTVRHELERPRPVLRPDVDDALLAHG